jgi:hypothetical protein
VAPTDSSLPSKHFWRIGRPRSNGRRPNDRTEILNSAALSITYTHKLPSIEVLNLPLVPVPSIKGREHVDPSIEMAHLAGLCMRLHILYTTERFAVVMIHAILDDDMLLLVDEVLEELCCAACKACKACAARDQIFCDATPNAPLLARKLPAASGAARNILPPEGLHAMATEQVTFVALVDHGAC